MKQLHHHQAYVIEEFAEEYHEHRLGRRDLLRRVLMVTGSVPLTASVLLALGCSDDAGDAAPTSTTQSEATTAPASTPATATGGSGPGISPTDPALNAAEVTFPGPAATMKGYLARPVAAGTHPGIIVIHENRGLTDHFRDVARRYAKEGFVALAIDLVSRQGGSTADSTANMAALRASTEGFVADLTAGVDYLKQQAFVKPNALGVTGFCFGGGYTWELAIANADIKAGVAYYGTVSAASMEKFGQTNAALLGIYGGNDTRVNAQIADVTARLQATGKPFEIKVYDGANHAFFNDTGGNYNKAAAEDAWPKTLGWFRTYLTG